MSASVTLHASGQRLLNLKHIVLVTFIVMLFHTVEEYLTAIYNVDPFMVFSSYYFGIRASTVYFIIQLLALVTIGVFFIRLSRHKFDTLLAVLVGFIFVLELLHPYNSIVLRAYYPGLYTGMILVLLGFFYYKELIAKKYE